MNPYDKKNLDFLMHASPDILAKWYAEVSEDDILYASELLAQASHEMERAALVAVAKECLMRDGENTDCSEAKTLLSKFTLKGIK